ncbi:MAG: hypothetical protein BRD53_04565 [Bacteroidetes bacterium SW_7_64_58]|nr:MAG: hypothetical protein BRD53_04565 [Bacteroidetes bacterium SW_7_64_58]
MTALAALALSLSAIAPQAAQGQTVEVVTNTNDAGNSSLRKAINTLNDGSGTDPDTIKFNISGSPPHTIGLSSELPDITDPLVVDGTTEPDYPSSTANGPVVQIDASGLGFGGDGLFVDATDSEIRGIGVVGAPNIGILLSTGTFVRVEDCFLGLEIDGTTVRGNEYGIYVTGNGATLNGNVVSGNDKDGILLDDNSNFVLNNIVGLDYNGDQNKGNGENGIDVESNNNLIGNAFFDLDLFRTFDNGNVVSGNGESGIEINGDENQVSANEVGTNSDGSAARGNGNNGIVVKGQNNLIGLDPPGSVSLITNTDDRTSQDRNLVSGNDKDGIVLGNNSINEASSQDTIRANVVGLNAGRNSPVPNGATTSADGGIVGSLTSGAVIDSNFVAGNEGQGIIIFEAGGDNKDILIYDNIVGTNRNFTSGLGNAYDGIQVKPNPGANGDDILVFENIVGNNDNDGIDIRGSFHEVFNNYVGAAPDGSDIGNGVSNQGRGIIMANGSSSLSNVIIGATGLILFPVGFPANGLAAGFDTPNGSGNVIGHNRADGILLRGQASAIEIGANYVGTNPGEDDFGNGSGANDGIRIVENGNSVSGVTIGYDEGTSFSSPDPADDGFGNVVAYNSGDGISVGSDESATSVSDVTARGNVVFQNGAANDTNVGIDLGNSAQTSNDGGDTDTGPNGLQNFPEITSVQHNNSSNEVDIEYEVNTNDTGSNYPLTVDFYVADSEASGEGKMYLGSQDYQTANTTNQVTFDLDNYSGVSSSDYFVATATDANGNTSEFFGPLGEQLPVELASFDATQSGESAVELRWTTASETNNAGFRVQHKASGETSWTKLGYVASKASGGTTTEAKTYRFDAEDLAVGTHEFRLKQMDLDGTAHLHDPVDVELQMQQALRLKAPAPNPVQGQAQLSFAVRDQTETTITMYNPLGQKVAVVYRGTPPAGEQQTAQVTTDDLASGVYFLRLQAGGATKTQKMTVVR